MVKYNPFVKYARYYTGRMFSDYVTPTKGGFRIESNTKPQGPFQTGSIERKMVTPRNRTRRKNSVVVVRTPGGKFAKLNRTGAITSKSAGRLKTRRFKKWPKKTKISMGGIELTVERGRNESTTGQTLWCGHSVVATEDLSLMMWRLIIKKLFAKVGVCVRDFSETATQNAYNISADDFIVVRYQTSDAGAVSSIGYTVAAGDTFENFAVFWNIQAALSASNVILKSIGFFPTTNAVGAIADAPMCRLDLEFQMVQMYFKSTMKIQNRTVNAAGDNEDSVDNVPLYGKSYSGVGNGVVQLAKATGAVAKQLIADRNTGYIQGSVTDGFDEPNHGQYFQYVQERGKVHLDPGYIKTSSLVYSKTMSLNRLNQYLYDTLQHDKTRNSFGKYRLFGIEKMIDTSAGGTTITLGLEINNYMSINMKSKFPNSTMPLFKREVLV